MKIICIGRNYAEHAAELHEQLNDSGKLPEEPMFFMKPDTALLRNNDPFYVPSFSQEVHYESHIQQPDEIHRNSRLSSHKI